jgi:predicted ATPase
MIHTLAVAGYRTLPDVVLLLGCLTLVTNANGSGKSNLYRSVRFLADIAQGRIISSLAPEGGLQSTLWAGPEVISRAMRAGEVPIQGIVRSGPVSLRQRRLAHRRHVGSHLLPRHRRTDRR